MMIRVLLFVASVVLFSCQPNSGSMKKGAASGYEYEVYKSTNGAKPNIGDYVYFNMDILDDNDSLLQSYRDQEILPSMEIFELTDVNRKKNAIADVLAELAVGDSVGIRVPIDSVGNLPPGFEDLAYLEYRVVCEEILSSEEQEAKVARIQQEQAEEAAVLKSRFSEVEALAIETIKKYKANQLELKETTNGVKYFIHELGDGDMPSKDRMLTMQYYGSLIDPIQKFDDSFNRGRGYSFRVGQRSVIAGWDEAALYLPIGTKASLFIPAEMGYGPQGSPPNIPGNAELYFYVEAEKLLF